VPLNLERIYRYRFQNVDQAARSSVWAEISNDLHDRLGHPACILDPAAGLGEFIASSPASERWAVDLVDHGLTRLDGVTVRIAPIQEADLPEGVFDAVFASNLLEHLFSPEDISELLERLLNLLRPGGVLGVMGPNFRYCSREYFDCADHRIALSDRAVAEHLYGAGFEIMSVTPQFLPYSFRSNLPASPRLTRVYLRTPALWKVFGKQFLVLGRRPMASAAAIGREVASEP
jgi:SAM-dependent methyltransferase